MSTGKELGAAAHKTLLGYQEVNRLIEGVGLLMDMHATLEVRRQQVQWENEIEMENGLLASQSFHRFCAQWAARMQPGCQPLFTLAACRMCRAIGWMTWRQARALQQLTCVTGQWRSTPLQRHMHSVLGRTSLPLMCKDHTLVGHRWTACQSSPASATATECAAGGQHGHW